MRNEVLYTREINGDFQIIKLDLNSEVRTQLTHINSWNTSEETGLTRRMRCRFRHNPDLLTTMWGKVKIK